MENKDVMRPDNEEKKVVEKKVSIAKMEKFPEIQEKIDKALSEGDVEAVLLLNELTLARNLQDNLSKPQQKQFGVIYVAFKGSNGVVKRAGVYNTSVISNSEEAEDILISEDFTDDRVLAVPRNSVFAELLK